MVDQPADALVEAVAEVADRAHDEHLEVPGGLRVGLFPLVAMLARQNGATRGQRPSSPSPRLACGLGPGGLRGAGRSGDEVFPVELATALVARGHRSFLSGKSAGAARQKVTG